jgi:hypothetical protein
MSTESATTEQPAIKPSHIVQLEIENVKRLHAVNITPEGNLMVIGGNNAQGKSSVLDAIAMILGGKDEVPAAPIHQGETKARIVADLGDIVVTRTFTMAGGTSLTVKMKDGSPVAGPQTILDKLTAKVVFDPFAFIRLDPRARAETLRKILGLDFTALDAKKAKAFNERTVVNRDVEQMRTVVAAMPVFKDAPAEEQGTAELVAQITEAGAHNAGKGLLKVQLDSAERAFTESLTNLGNITREVAELEARLADAQKRLVATKEAHDKNTQDAEAARTKHNDFKVVDVAPLTTKLTELEATNTKVRQNKDRATKVSEGQAKKAKSDELTKIIESVDAERTKLLKSAKYPVAGLGFSDSGVTYNNLPFEQSSSAEQLRISVAIAAATHPTLRVMLVRDGSLLDENSLKLLGELAKEHDLQVWVERVGKGAECSVIIEDGSVLVTA